MCLLDLAEVDQVTARHPMGVATPPRTAALPSARLPGRPGPPPRPCGARPGRAPHRPPPRRPGGPIGQPAHLGLAVQPDQPVLLRRAHGKRRARRHHPSGGRGPEHPVARADHLRGGRARGAPVRQGPPRVTVPPNGRRLPAALRRTRTEAGRLARRTRRHGAPLHGPPVPSPPPARPGLHRSPTVALPRSPPIVYPPASTCRRPGCAGAAHRSSPTRPSGCRPARRAPVGTPTATARPTGGPS